MFEFSRGLGLKFFDTTVVLLFWVFVAMSWERVRSYCAISFFGNERHWIGNVLRVVRVCNWELFYCKSL